MDVAETVHDFWFEGRLRYQERWFKVDPAFDRAVARALLPLHERAAAGMLADLAAGPRGALALVLLLDQVPRNAFRGTARAFATDAAALGVARYAVGLGHDLQLHPVERLFLYLPFEHSERLADQERSIELYTGLGDRLALEFAHRHRDIVLRFGRFPHRNRILGRATTPDEAEFLTRPNSSF